MVSGPGCRNYRAFILIIPVAVRMVKSAVVGCGTVATWKHLPALELHPAVNLVAVCDTDRERLDQTANEYDIEAYADVGEMMSEANLDSVHVCTPPQTHLPIVSEVMRAGVSVLIEKPVALDSADVREMLSLSERTGVIASVVHNKLFHRQVQDALRAVERGRIGDVVSATMLFSEPQHNEHPQWTIDIPGGGLGEGLPHQIYPPLGFVGRLDEVSSVYTGDVTGNNNFGFDALKIQAEDVNNRLVSIEVLANPAHRDYLLVQGTDGELRVDLLNRNSVELHSDADIDFIEKLFTNSAGMIRELGAGLIENGIDFGINEVQRQLGRYNRDANGHYELIDQFVRAVESETEPPVSLEQGLDTTRVAEAVAQHVTDRS